MKGQMMKTIIAAFTAAFDGLANILSLLAAIPTAWAVYRGVTLAPVFPFDPLAAWAASGAVILVSLQAGRYLMAARGFNATLKQREISREHLAVPLWWGWAVVGLGVAGEVVLTLLVGIMPGIRAYSVLVFPLMTLAGVFCYILQADLQERVAVRDRLRADAARPPQGARKAAEEVQMDAASAAQLPQGARKVRASKAQYKYTCDIAGCKKPHYNSKGAHMRQHHPDLCKPGTVEIDPSLLIRKTGT